MALEEQVVKKLIGKKIFIFLSQSLALGVCVVVQ